MTKVFRAILFFGFISIVIDLIRKLIFAKFEMTRILSLDYFIFELLLEFLFLIITAFATHLIMKKMSKDNLILSLTKALLFGIIYGIISLISSRIIYLSIGGGLGFQFDFYESFVKFIPNGFTQGVLFLLVMHHLSPKNRTLTDNTHKKQ